MSHNKCKLNPIYSDHRLKIRSNGGQMQLFSCFDLVTTEHSLPCESSGVHYLVGVFYLQFAGDSLSLCFAELLDTDQISSGFSNYRDQPFWLCPVIANIAGHDGE
jgi:hypothetical protein